MFVSLKSVALHTILLAHVDLQHNVFVCFLFFVKSAVSLITLLCNLQLNLTRRSLSLLLLWWIGSVSLTSLMANAFCYTIRFLFIWADVMKCSQTKFHTLLEGQIYSLINKTIWSEREKVIDRARVWVRGRLIAGM